MPNTKVGLYKRVQVEEGEMRFLPVAKDEKGRFLEDTVQHNEQPVKREDGSYYVRYRDGKRQVSLCLKGNSFADAVAFHKIKEAELQARAAGAKIVETVHRSKANQQAAPAPKTPAKVVPDNRVLLSDALASWLAEYERKPKKATWMSYRSAVDMFKECCTKNYLDELGREDVLAYVEHLRGKKLHPKTINGKYQVIVRFANAKKLKLEMEKGDRPKFTRKKGMDVELYEQEELDVLFAVCPPYESLVLQTFLETGFREQEIMHLYWSDIDFKRGEISVTAKPEWDWQAKDYEVRHVPVSDDLIAKLKTHKAESRGVFFLFFNHEIIALKLSRSSPSFGGRSFVDFHCLFLDFIFCPSIREADNDRDSRRIFFSRRSMSETAIFSETIFLSSTQVPTPAQATSLCAAAP
jgi:integrase